MTADDPQQAAAASSSSANLLVIAPPGCGKTELLAQRAKALIRGLLPGQKILALTFTNRAKANLSERLRRILGAQRVPATSPCATSTATPPRSSLRTAGPSASRSTG
jgi:DNA helicase-2/ATP-dependent DNA helicase PcrA